MHCLFGWVLLLHFHQVLAHNLVHPRRLRELLARDSTPLVGIGVDETAIDRQVVPLHQSRLRQRATISSNNCSNTFENVE
jgi:hypothetical protein